MPRHQAPPGPPEPLEVVNPFWLLKAVAITLIAALVCAWLALCLLFYQGQWQLVLHPARSSQPLDHLAGLPSTPVRFDAADTGVPRLSGALILPAAPTRLAPYTVLYLRGGDSSLSQNPTDAATIGLLHSLGLTVFAFDYRGFGASDPIHPTLQRMTEDTQAALRYLLGRGIPEPHLLLYGSGIGNSLAATLAHDHPTLPALILDAPVPPSLSIVQADPRTRALPVRWLFHEEFSLQTLASLKTPKLLISYPPASSPTPPPAYVAAADPKTTLELPSATAAPQRAQALTRFLDEYLPASAR